MKTLLKLTVFAFSILSIYTTKAAAITSAAQCAAYSQAQHWPMAWQNGQCVNMGGVGPAIPPGGIYDEGVGPELDPQEGGTYGEGGDVPVEN